MLNNSLWLGSQASYDNFLAAKEKASGQPQADASWSLLNVNDGVGVIDIQGSLANGSFGPLGQMLGVTGYADIQDALVQAVVNKDVKSILLNVDSGGGHVSGVHDTAKLIANVSKVKPMATYSGGMMASAALWLGASTGNVTVSDTAIVGSIGVLMVHMDRSGQLAQDGKKATIIRAGEFKALVNPYEPLTDAAKAEMQGQATYLYDIFLGHMADMRGTTLMSADTKFGQGREFIGAQALNVGLVDAIGNLSDAFTAVKTQQKPDNKRQMSAKAEILGDNMPNLKGENMKNPLPTAEQLVALAAGVSLTPVAEAAAQVIESTPAAPEVNPLQAELDQTKADLAQVQTDLADAQTSLTDAQASLQAQVPTLEGLSAIVQASAKNMAMNLGATFDATADLLSEHKRIADLFVAKYKTGGVAATKVEPVAAKPAKAELNPLFLSALQFSKSLT